MKQNIYDDPKFFRGLRSTASFRPRLNAALEWPAVRGLLPRLSGNRVLDLGCGFGHALPLDARAECAASVVVVDLSERMLERARAMTSDSAMEYRCCAIEDLNLTPAGFDLVTSSLALPAIADGKTKPALC